MTPVITTVSAHTDTCMKDFDVVIAYHLQCVEKWGLTMNIKFASVAQERPPKKQMASEACGAFN